ncbi:IS1556 transposase [Mycobacterium tuberculosis]|nr:IS1556 transposase [Mycobacterium tuberculosis]
MCDVVSFVGAAERVLRARFRPSPESGPPVHARRCGWSLGISAETLRRWAGQAEVDSGVVAGVSASRSGSVKTSELEQTIEILKVATSFFVNRPGMSGDSSSWKGWGHVRWFIEEVPAGAA